MGGSAAIGLISHARFRATGLWLVLAAVGEWCSVADLSSYNCFWAVLLREPCAARNELVGASLVSSLSYHLNLLPPGLYLVWKHGAMFCLWFVNVIGHCCFVILVRSKNEWVVMVGGNCV